MEATQTHQCDHSRYNTTNPRYANYPNYRIFACQGCSKVWHGEIAQTPVADIRRYENFSIRWTDGHGGSISGFDTRAEAEDYMVGWNGDHRPGEIVRKTWTVEVAPKYAHIYLPGIPVDEDAEAGR